MVLPWHFSARLCCKFFLWDFFLNPRLKCLHPILLCILLRLRSLLTFFFSFCCCSAQSAAGILLTAWVYVVYRIACFFEGYVRHPPYRTLYRYKLQFLMMERTNKLPLLYISLISLLVDIHAFRLACKQNSPFTAKIYANKNKTKRT